MENLNSCCFVGRINEIKPIPGADNIVQAVVGGWNCIIQKGQYNVNDLVVVATTDAVIPQQLSDAMNVTNYLRKGQRVRTVKLKGVYSECLIIPITFIPDKYKQEGIDCMELMSIFKYEPPVRQVMSSGGRKIKYKDNPYFSVYYKFPNLKNVPNLFTEEDYVEITRKIHGTNARYGIVKKTKLSLMDRVKLWLNKTFNVGGDEWKYCNYDFVVGSHNVEKGSDSQGYYGTNVWYEISDKYNIKQRLWKIFKEYRNDIVIENSLIIYGEIYGPGIQKNYDYGLKELQFSGFDIEIDGGYCDMTVTPYIFKKMDLPYVPILHFGCWSQEIQDKYVFNNYIEGTKVPHEGVVIKHISGNRHKVAKIINPEYLTYGEKHNVGDSH